MLEIHSRPSQLPPIRVRSRTSEKNGIYSASCVGVSDAIWMHVAWVYEAGPAQGSGRGCGVLGTWLEDWSLCLRAFYGAEPIP